MSSRLTAYALAVALVAAISGFTVFHMMSGRVNQLEANLQVASETIESTNRALQVKDRAVSDLTAKYKLKSKELDDALKSNPDWSTSRVPDAVFDSLFDTH